MLMSSSFCIWFLFLYICNIGKLKLFKYHKRMIFCFLSRRRKIFSFFFLFIEPICDVLVDQIAITFLRLNSYETEKFTCEPSLCLILHSQYFTNRSHMRNRRDITIPYCLVTKILAVIKYTWDFISTNEPLRNKTKNKQQYAL